MKNIKLFVGAVALAASSLASATALTGTCTSAAGCDVIGFANANGYSTTVTTGVATGGNKTSAPSVAGASVTFADSVVGNVTATATTAGAASLAIQNLSANNAGLGVTTSVLGLASTTSETIDGTDVLTLTFANTVQLSAAEFDDKNDSQVCTLIVICSYSPGTDLLTSATKFSVSVNGGAAQKFSLGNGTTNNVIALTGLVGKTFSFSVDTASGSTPFYIAALQVQKAVPEPSSYAILGLGLLGFAWAARRRA